MTADASTHVRVAGRVHGSAVVFVTDDQGDEVRVRWTRRRGWRCDLDGSSRTTHCLHVAAAVRALTAHLLTADLTATNARRKELSR